MYALMHWYGREPRVVLKDTLAWDPAIDVLLNRLPSRFISPHAEGADGDVAGAADRRAGPQPRRERRVRDLPGGRQLHPRAPAARHRQAAPPRPGGDGAPGRADAERAGPPARRPARRAGRRARGRRGPGRAHRARPPAHGRATSGASCRWTSRSSCAGGGCRARRSPRVARPASTGCSPGGSRSTRGSPSTARSTCLRGVRAAAGAPRPTYDAGPRHREVRGPSRVRSGTTSC